MIPASPAAGEPQTLAGVKNSDSIPEKRIRIVKVVYIIWEISSP